MTTKEKLVLVADDEKSFRSLVGRSLSGRNYRLTGTGDGVSALRLARIERPELILLDLGMPKKNGWEVLRDLRCGIQTRAIPVIILSGSAKVSDKIAAFDLGADGYLTKPLDVNELPARVDGLLRGNKRALSVDALTRLPGGPMMEQAVARRIAQGIPFSFSRLDIDNFTAFNKFYSLEQGDELLLEIAGILLCAMAEGGLEDDFAGHLGGDDFVAISSPERGEILARAVTKNFDRSVARFSSPYSSGVAGVRVCGPVPRLSIGIVSSRGRKIDHYGKVAEISADLLRYLKGRGSAGRSAYLLDRRNDFNRAAGLKRENRVSVF